MFSIANPASIMQTGPYARFSKGSLDGLAPAQSELRSAPAHCIRLEPVKNQQMGWRARGAKLRLRASST
jgi:hypothetical protein